MLHRAPCVCCKCVCKRCLYVAPNIFFFHFGYAIFNGNILILPLLFHFIHGNSFVFALKMSDLSDSGHCISNVIALMRFVVDSREPHWFTLCVTIGKNALNYLCRAKIECKCQIYDYLLLIISLWMRFHMHFRLVWSNFVESSRSRHQTRPARNWAQVHSRHSSGDKEAKYKFTYKNKINRVIVEHKVDSDLFALIHALAM